MLREAGAEGRLETLTVLLEYGADANVQSLTGSTTLMITCRGGSYECVEFLCSLIDDHHGVVNGDALERFHRGAAGEELPILGVIISPASNHPTKCDLIVLHEDAVPFAKGHASLTSHFAALARAAATGPPSIYCTSLTTSC